MKNVEFFENITDYTVNKYNYTVTPDVDIYFKQGISDPIEHSLPQLDAKLQLASKLGFHQAAKILANARQELAHHITIFNNMLDPEHIPDQF